jgi:hypothetical protein
MRRGFVNVAAQHAARERIAARVALNTQRHWAQRDGAEREISRAADDWRRAANWRPGTRPVASDMPDSMLRLLAGERARLMAEWLAELTQADDAAGTMARLNQAVEPLNGRPFPFDPCKPHGEQLRGAMERARCEMWWRRQLRRECVRLRETEAMQRGEVCKRRRQPYVTDDTVRRKAERNAANAAMLERTELEDEGGEVITLAQAVAASTSNKAIRRGELMTRIRGCEEWANEAGMVGLFTTNTAPSRFHSQTMHQGANPKHDGSTPREAQRWLCDTWARARAALQRAGVRFFGFRVAEPHHDGCPHWHMLLWVDAAHLGALRATMRAYWLKDAGDEPGAQEHRFKAVDIDPARGGAVAYVSKYIAKNIDDVGALEAEGHTDEHAGEQGELFEATAKRVEAWASAWGIRQFQAIGQPPVTVWRELRRIDAQAVAGASDAIKLAHQAVNREGLRRACWRTYLRAQGGAMTGRDYRVRIVADMQQREGRYGSIEIPRPLGVEDAKRIGEWVLSSRREWKPRGTWSTEERQERTERVLREVVWGRPAQPVSPPRTRVNNCTQGMAPLWAALAWSTPNGGVRIKESHERPPENPPSGRSG